MDEYRSCRNKCMFCFIDQMPEGMRDTLYFKDDDSRLSFLQGNYVTLTNMSDHDIERIIRYRLEPINISFQTTNPQLRCKMLHNRFAGDALKKVDRLFEGGIEMNGQIVLCKGENDGAELERSIKDLTAYIPLLRSVSVVPVGLSKVSVTVCEPSRAVYERRMRMRCWISYSQMAEIAGLCGVRNSFHPRQGMSGNIARRSGRCRRKSGMTDIFSLENGVGMLRLLLDEFTWKGTGESRQGTSGRKNVSMSMATGQSGLSVSVAPWTGKDRRDKFPNVHGNVMSLLSETTSFGESHYGVRTDHRRKDLTSAAERRAVLAGRTAH